MNHFDIGSFDLGLWIGTLSYIIIPSAIKYWEGKRKIQKLTEEKKREVEHIYAGLERTQSDRAENAGLSNPSPIPLETIPPDLINFTIHMKNGDVIFCNGAEYTDRDEGFTHFKIYRSNRPNLVKCAVETSEIRYILSKDTKLKSAPQPQAATGRRIT